MSLPIVFSSCQKKESVDVLVDVPEDFLESNYDRCVRLPMRNGIRSLNLSNAVAIGVYEILRQHNFEGQLAESDYLSGDGFAK